MAEPKRSRLIDSETFQRNADDDELADAVRLELDATPLERKLAAAVLYHYDKRSSGINICSNCSGDD